LSKEKKIPLVTRAILSIPYVKYLLDLVSDLILELGLNKKKVEELEAELRRLKKIPKKPKIEASKLDEEKPKKGKRNKEKRPGSEKKKKKKDLPIDEYRKIEAKEIPKGWHLIGYKPYVIQDVIVSRNTIKYEREIWESPNRKERIVASLPNHLKGRHFGPVLRSYVINLYNSCHVTQPLIWQLLHDMGVDISKGEINHLLNGDRANDMFEKELLEVVKQGIVQSKEIRTDDTSARHQGKNAFCNCINSDLFTYFKTTSSKSRINFLSVLQLDKTGYRLTEESIGYCEQGGLAPRYINILNEEEEINLKTEDELFDFFKKRNISAKYARRIITESLLIGCLLKNGFDKDKFIHADDAGQFKVFNHSICWKHAERPLKKVVIRNDLHQEQWDDKVSEFWQLYQGLKKYKEVSSLAQKRRKKELDQRFDKLCEEVENFEALNLVLAELKKKKSELLLVLDHPFVSLHNNNSERDIREYAKRRKISGSTRNENGKKSRDVFTSLKKTCRKLGVSFWEYTKDRIEEKNKIPPLADILLQRSQLNIS
jgi:hypothetical protein